MNKFTEKDINTIYNALMAYGNPSKEERGSTYILKLLNKVDNLSNKTLLRQAFNQGYQFNAGSSDGKDFDEWFNELTENFKDNPVPSIDNLLQQRQQLQDQLIEANNSEWKSSKDILKALESFDKYYSNILQNGVETDKVEPLKDASYLGGIEE